MEQPPLDDEQLELVLEEPPEVVTEPTSDWFAELQVNVKTNGVSPISFLPVL
jgi:hypothetical protein